jgi:hypothetical protein
MNSTLYSADQKLCACANQIANTKVLKSKEWKDRPFGRDSLFLLKTWVKKPKVQYLFPKIKDR